MVMRVKRRRGRRATGCAAPGGGPAVVWPPRRASEASTVRSHGGPPGPPREAHRGEARAVRPALRRRPVAVCALAVVCCIAVPHCSTAPSEAQRSTRPSTPEFLRVIPSYSELLRVTPSYSEFLRVLSTRNRLRSVRPRPSPHGRPPSRSPGSRRARSVVEAGAAVGVAWPEPLGRCLPGAPARPQPVRT